MAAPSRLDPTQVIVSRGNHMSESVDPRHHVLKEP